jgi:glycosyltransferase involved in cell wall biosynthesis
MSRKKVVLSIDSLMNGGAQRQIVVLANVLHERGYEVVLLTYYPGDQLSQFIVSEQIRRVLLRRHSKYDIGYFPRLYRYLREEKPDCMISYMSTPSFWARLAGRPAGIPKIITSERNINITQQRSLALLERLLAPLSDAIVVNSHEGRRRLEALGIPARQLHVIYNGVDCQHFCHQPEAAIRRLRDDLGVSADDRLVLLPGRMETQKNHQLLVEAALAIGPAASGIKVAFAGNEFSTVIKDDITARITAAGATGRFLFLGPRPDMPLLYSAADVVVLPSLWEGFPNVVIEAMACGTPVIVSDISDNARIVEQGVSGWLFPNNDAAALADALSAFLRLSANECHAMGERAAAHIRTLCSTEALGDRYCALIEPSSAMSPRQ